MCIFAYKSVQPRTIAREGSDIDVVFTADSTPGEFRQYVDVFINERKHPVRLKIHGFITIDMKDWITAVQEGFPSVKAMLW